MIVQVQPSQPVIAAAPIKLYCRNEDGTAMLRIALRILDKLIAEKTLPVRRMGRRGLITRDILLSFPKLDHRTGVIQ